MTELYECGWCGKNLEGPPPQECEKCKGRAPVQERNYTLSEIQSGVAPKDSNRYGKDGDTISPKIRTDLPGAGGPGGTPNTN